MKEKIIEILRDETKAKSVNEINQKLGLRTTEEIQELENVLAEMTKDGIVHESKKHEFLLMTNTKTLKCGIITINKNGNGFVDIPGQDDVFIRSECLNGAITGVGFLHIEDTYSSEAQDIEYVGQFLGKGKNMLTVTKSDSATETEINAISGATITSKATTNAVNAALYYLHNYLE